MGGTGGHIVPALALSNMCAKQGIEPCFVGHRLQDHPCLRDCVYDVLDVRSAPIKILPIHEGIKNLYHLGKAVSEAYRAIKRLTPDVVVGFGSIYSLPGVLAGVMAKVPVVLHEQNMKPGLVNRYCERFARGVGVVFPEAAASHTYRCPSVEAVKMTQNERFSPEAYLPYEWDQGQNVVLGVIGGSQGAQRINQLVPQAVCMACRQGLQLRVIHVVGPNQDLHAVQHIYRQGGVPAIVKRFEYYMDSFLSACDVVISRAGATTMRECIGSGTPAIMIPYPGARAHQEHNARFFSDCVRGGLTVLDRDMSVEGLACLLKDYVSHRVLHQYTRNLIEYTHAKLVSLPMFTDFISRCI